MISASPRISRMPSSRAPAPTARRMASCRPASPVTPNDQYEEPIMETARITVQAIKPPQPGKQRSLVITTDGRKFGCFPEKLHLVQPGQTYDVELSDGQYP